MRLSQKADYALRAMFYLAQHNTPERLARAAEIARQEKIPAKFLEVILVELRKAGLVRSQRGAEGGHALARDPSRITVGDIWRAIDGPLSVAAELRASAGRGPAARGLSAVWQEVEQAVNGVVDRVTLDEVLRRADARRGVVDFSI